jgi:glycine oxidase
VRSGAADVLIYGAGVIGCAIARNLAAEGASVLVVERSRPGQEASGAAAGLLTPQSHAVRPGPFPDLARESLALFPELARELASETSLDIGFRMCGSIRLPSDDDAETSDLMTWQDAAGWRVERIGTERLSRLTRGRLSSDFSGALEFRNEGAIDPRLFTRALAESAESRGVKFLLGESVGSIRRSGNLCIGVETGRGPIDAGAVINAAGAWAGPPVRPVRGQIVELKDAGAAPACPIFRGDFYIVPLAGGRLLLGSTQEDAGFEKKVTAQAVRQLLGRAFELIPSLAEAEVSGAWAGLRPGTPDSLPLLGETSLERLFLAAGHFRNGILLAPITGKILTALVLGRNPPVDLEPFRAERFAFTPPRNSW